MVTNKRLIRKNGPDFYPTPEWATKALLDKEAFTSPILEPCCGSGDMDKVITSYGFKTEASDLYDYGYGKIRDINDIKCSYPSVITNPPYNLASELFPIFYDLAIDKLALLLRLSFLESKRRYPLFQKYPLTKIYIFSERLSLYPKGEKVKGGGMVSYGWFIWDKNDYKKFPEMDWIEPGYKNI